MLVYDRKSIKFKWEKFQCNLLKICFFSSFSIVFVIPMMIMVNEWNASSGLAICTLNTWSLCVCVMCHSRHIVQAKYARIDSATSSTSMCYTCGICTSDSLRTMNNNKFLAMAKQKKNFPFLHLPLLCIKLWNSFTCCTCTQCTEGPEAKLMHTLTHSLTRNQTKRKWHSSSSRSSSARIFS